jgi:cysteinyl-tRNA synthetase
MTLRLYNTLSRSIEEFAPADAASVGVYACGPTVYRPPHIGNFRTFVFNDVLHRYLEWKGFGVRFVMNLTDVEDKIIDAAAATGVPITTITTPVTEAFFADLERLGIRPADVYPRATAHIGDMIELIRRLFERGHAYEAGGSVYFDISSFPDYGRLSRVALEDTVAGAGLAARELRTDADEYEKGDARDFVLWKGAKDSDRAVGATWDTPWGPGRPGWHIECSAMSIAQLGESFDIHTGGEDLIFPHHEDEIAQSEGATGRQFARVWLHVKHLLVNGEKMSKSKRNDYRLPDLAERGFGASAVRFLYLSAHYRNELNFTFEGLEDARSALQRLLDFARRLEEAALDDDAAPSGLAESAAAGVAEFQEAMDDDLNTPNALAALFRFVRDGNAAMDRARGLRPAERDVAQRALRRFDDALGLLELARRDTGVDPELAAWVDERIEARQEARMRRDFETADAIRDELSRAGIAIEDTPRGTRWKKALAPTAEQPPLV